MLTNISSPRSQVNRKELYEKNQIRKGATIGANVTIICGVTIGRYAFVAAGAVVTKDVPNYGLVIGNPARRVGWMSMHGHSLEKADSDGTYVCRYNEMRYREDNGRLSCCDLKETMPLPVELRKGKKHTVPTNNLLIFVILIKF